MRLEAAGEALDSCGAAGGGTEATRGHPRSGLGTMPCDSWRLGKTLSLLQGEKSELPFSPAGVEPGSSCLMQ